MRVRKRGGKGVSEGAHVSQPGDLFEKEDDPERVNRRDSPEGRQKVLIDGGREMQWWANEPVKRGHRHPRPSNSLGKKKKPDHKKTPNQGP